jgi:hypothetical protein
MVDTAVAIHHAKTSYRGRNFNLNLGLLSTSPLVEMYGQVYSGKSDFSQKRDDWKNPRFLLV